MNQDEPIRNMTQRYAVELERAGYAMFAESADQRKRLPVIYAPRWTGDGEPWVTLTEAKLRFSHLTLVAVPTIYTMDRAADTDTCRRCGAAEGKPRLCQYCEDRYIHVHLHTDPEFQSL